jgi:predicted nucleic acid-binding protein
VGPDPDDPPVHSIDPNDDYLLALAAGSSAVLASGDRHLLDLRERWPVVTPQRFLLTLSEAAQPEP